MKTNQGEDKEKGRAGRKTLYTPERVEIIRDAIAKGETEAEACRRAGISDETLRNWKRDKLEFLSLLKSAEKEAQEWELNGILASAKKSLRVLIEGKEYDETKTEYENDPNNPGQPRIKRQIVTKKIILPSATAVIFALCNRDPENWRQRVEQEIRGTLNGDVTSSVNLDKVPDDVLAKVLEAIRD